MTWLLYQALPSWMCKSILCLMRNQIKLVVIDNDVILWLLWNFDNHKLWGMFEDQQEEWSLFLVLKEYLNFTIRLRGGIMCNTLGRVFHVFIYILCCHKSLYNALMKSKRRNPIDQEFIQDYFHRHDSG